MVTLMRADKTEATRSALCVLRTLLESVRCLIGQSASARSATGVYLNSSAKLVQLALGICRHARAWSLRIPKRSSMPCSPHCQVKMRVYVS